jgi:hypothetical protein
MKFILMLSVLAVSFSSFAASVVIKSTEGKDINISTIERSITVDSSDGRLNVVEVDNGGSTDISSAAEPSSLLLTLFKDGEMVNLSATFELGRIYSLKSAKLLDKKTVAIEVEVKDLMLKLSTKKITVNIADLRAKVAKPAVSDIEFGTQVIKAKVVSSEKLGID